MLSSPYIAEKTSVTIIMLKVLAALVPGIAAYVWLFGPAILVSADPRQRHRAGCWKPCGASARLAGQAVPDGWQCAGHGLAAGAIACRRSRRGG